MDHRLLERVGLALNSTLELSEVLHQLTAVSLEAGRADRCSIFLLEGNKLNPITAIGELRNEDLLAAFRAMGPVDLDSIPSAWDLLAAGRAVPIEDAATSPLIPNPWVERFGLRSLALVPLFAVTEPCGLMTMDYQYRRTFSDEELRLYEAIGSYAGIAVRNAHLFHTTRRRSELNEGLVRASAGLVSPRSRRDLLARLIESYTDLFEARLCAIGLVDRPHSRVQVMAARGTKKIEESLPISRVPYRIKERLSRVWRESEVVDFPDDEWLAEFLGGRRVGASRYVLVPLHVDGLHGGVLLGFPAHVHLDAEERRAAKALGAIASASLERNLLVDRTTRQLRRLEILHALGDALAEQADARALTKRLNHLLSDHGIEVVALVFRDRTLAPRLKGETPLPEERNAWRARKPFAKLPDGSLSVAMRLGRRVVGSVRVRPGDIEEEELAFVEALAHGVAEVASRGALRAAVEDASRESAVVAERGRIAADLHDTAGQLFVAIGLLSRREAEHLPGDSPWHQKFGRLAELADTGKWEISRAIQALAFFPEARRGIAPSLKALARSFQADSGIETVVETSGTQSRLSPQIERALYRVAHEALSNAWRHSRCDIVRIRLEFGSSEVTLRVLDDGAGMRRVGTLVGVGIAGMRRSLDEVGGSLRLKPLKPHGTVVEARVGKESR